MQTDVVYHLYDVVCKFQVVFLHVQYENSE